MRYTLKGIWHKFFPPGRVEEKRSYSQCGEDLIADHIFQQLKIARPTYIDIGAHHPKYLNNTYLFYKKGARGINIEPDPSLFREFEKQRPEDINLNIGIGDTEGDADFYIMNEPTLNTFVKEEADKAHEEHEFYKITEVRKLRLRPVMSIISEYCNGKFPDFLSLDVEGLDEMIIRSIDFSKGGPVVICVETITFSAKRQGRKKTELIDFLVQQGYLVYADTYINTIFVRKDSWAS
jgi:FkbM family methyltransferase